jgi:chloride channel 3/4/5
MLLFYKVSKWVADAMYKEGVYDLLIEMKGYPFLESKKDYVHTMTIDQLTESLSTIDIDEPITVDQLRYKLSIVSDLGYGEDGGFPILRDGRILEGYIATSELQHGLEQLERSLESSLSDADIGTVLCYFKKSETAYGITSYSLDSTLDDTIRNLLIQNTSKQNLEGSIETRLLLNEFIQYVDHVSFLV